jgi:hypothetical protein
MIKEKEIFIKLVYKNINKYKKLGYDCSLNENVLIKVIDLYPSSHVVITAICDICAVEKQLSYQKYNKNINKYNIYTCEKCSHIKNKLTCQERYNDENYTNKEKYKDTVTKKYDCDNVFKSDIIKEKIKETNNIKYNVDYPQQNKDILQKSIVTNNIKYNCDRPSQNEKIKRKIKETKKIKYNDESYNNINKIKNTVLEKYNIENVSQLPNHKEKIHDYTTHKILNKYPYINEIDYINNNYIGTCEENHIYTIGINSFHNRISHNINPCTVCYPMNTISSDKENKLYEFIKSKYHNEIIINDRKILNGKELDIYLPELNLAFEFNGLYWHSTEYKEPNYHYNKTEICEAQGIRLIHIYEDDWKYKQEIVQSRIMNLLGKNRIKIYARKCIIKEISNNSEVRNFLNTNHLQGFVGSQIKLGLYYNNELVSLMTFGKQRKALGSKSKDDVFEMLRFCNKLNTTVIGSANKLFNYFIKNYKPKEVISYADRSWSQGNLYKVLGFTYIHKTKPNYYYIIDGIRHYRYGFRKDILVKQGYDPNKTEQNIMLEKNIYKIYNSGNVVFKKIIT